MAALRIGLTGGIGSGKSTVAGMLADLGAAVIDTDAIARSLAAPGGAAIDALREQFGTVAIGADGGLDRARMRQLVFTDPAAKSRLEAILHPLIGLETDRQASTAGDRPRVFDVPLLVESGRWRARVDRVLVVDCSAATQVARVTRRSDWAVAAVQAVIDQQASREARRAAADAVIFNEDLSLAELAADVSSLWTSWIETRSITSR
ncbi:dephospho-CoA kinase [Rhizobacter sp. OV335]|uniref:dephospho-CoA kinase n=1 Tax=Rhizobacter sp. OV335 TaxID=1500264 RepID=UPI000919240B|nr:dephospho-CoA kinase [Rhizobacter sp. OV335]SHL99980.1 dephospho-CoA kinase [Rhizobacter sp. OV335]